MRRRRIAPRHEHGAGCAVRRSQPARQAANDGLAVYQEGLRPDATGGLEQWPGSDPASQTRRA